MREAHPGKKNKKLGYRFYANFLVTVADGCFLPLQVLGFCAAGNHFAVHQGLSDCHHFSLHCSGALFFECILEPERRMERQSAADGCVLFNVPYDIINQHTESLLHRGAACK